MAARLKGPKWLWLLGPAVWIWSPWPKTSRPAVLIEVLVEGGPRIATSLLEAGLVDELTVYFGAKVAGGTGIPMFASILTGIDAAIDVDLHSVTRIGPDLRIDAKVREARS